MLGLAEKLFNPKYKVKRTAGGAIVFDELLAKQSDSEMTMFKSSWGATLSWGAYVATRTPWAFDGGDGKLTVAHYSASTLDVYITGIFMFTTAGGFNTIKMMPVSTFLYSLTSGSTILYLPANWQKMNTYNNDHEEWRNPVTPVGPLTDIKWVVQAHFTCTTICPFMRLYATMGQVRAPQFESVKPHTLK